jgi:hypothetical protein
MAWLACKGVTCGYGHDICHVKSLFIATLVPCTLHTCIHTDTAKKEAFITQKIERPLSYVCHY